MQSTKGHRCTDFDGTAWGISPLFDALCHHFKLMDYFIAVLGKGCTFVGEGNRPCMAV